MPDPVETVNKLLTRVHSYCLEKGVVEGPGVNNLVPHDPVLAWAMARYLVEDIGFDSYVVVEPEGHVYGFFFEELGVSTVRVRVGFPARSCEVLDDLECLRGTRVLVIEDDVIGGATLRLVAGALARFRPASMALYLGHKRWVQSVENVPPTMDPVFVAEDTLDMKSYDRMECALLERFA